jgi:hypothetical protein
MDEMDSFTPLKRLLGFIRNVVRGLKHNLNLGDGGESASSWWVRLTVLVHRWASALLVHLRVCSLVPPLLSFFTAIHPCVWVKRPELILWIHSSEGCAVEPCRWK